MKEYYEILIFFFITLLVGILLFGISYIIGIKKNTSEKLSAYECGFEPFEDARITFDIKFYLVAVLFIIFDLEVVFLFPWAVLLSSLQLTALWILYFFLVLLTIGFIYEWKKGALNWK